MKILHGKLAGHGMGRVQNGGCVAFAEDKPVVTGILWLGIVITKIEKKYDYQIFLATFLNQIHKILTTVLCKMYLTPLVKYYINRVSLSQDYAC